MKLKHLFEDEYGLADFLDNNNFNWRGGFSEVYDLGCNCVLKVTEDIPYLSFFRMIEQEINNEDLHLPVIYDHWVINDCYYITMEKLEHHDLNISLEADCAGYYCYDSGLWLGVNKSLDKTLDKLDTWFNTFKEQDGLTWDLRDTNIMQRKDGTLVITDPFSESEYNTW